MVTNMRVLCGWTLKAKHRGLLAAKLLLALAKIRPIKAISTVSS
jgi:hypothetical protein